MRLRWPTKYLPGFPAFLLVPAVLGLWAQLCITDSPHDASLSRGLSILYKGRRPQGPRGFPFTFSPRVYLVPDEESTLADYPEIRSIFRMSSVVRWTGFQIIPFLIDLALALTVAYMFAMAVDRLLLSLVRKRSRRKSTDTSMSIRWPGFLPRLPALLLIPALVPAWASLMWSPESSPQGYERGYPLAFETYRNKVRSSFSYWNLGTTLFISPVYSDRSDFQLPHFLVDLAVALVVAYLLAMAVERLLFPLVRRLHGKKPEQGEAG